MMTSIKLVALSSLVVCLVGGIVSSPALALPGEGPFWRVSNGVPPSGESKAITGKLLAGTESRFYGIIGAKNVRINCKAASFEKGEIFNGAQQGESNESIDFSECSLFEESGGVYKELTNCNATVAITKAHNTLWYHSVNGGTKTERTSTTQVVFSPAEGTTFTTITFVGEGCGIFEGAFKVMVSAAGATGIAAEPSPQNTEVGTGKWVFTTEVQKHVWRPTGVETFTEAQPTLIFNAKPARLEAQVEVQLSSKESFGIFETKGRLNAIPNPFNFGGVKKETSEIKEVTIKNVGLLATGVLPTATLTNPPLFEITKDDCKANPLASGAECKIKVKFEPKTVAEFDATLTIPTYITVRVEGKGTP